MKILLINPSLIQSSVGHYSKSLEKNRGIYPSLGLGYIASALIDDGHIVFIADYDALSNPQLYIEGIMERIKPDMVGFYLMTWTFKEGLTLLNKVKWINNNVITVAGGPQVSSFPKETLELGNFDYAILGEGEHTAKELVNMIEYNLNPTNIDGLVWRNGEQIIQNKPRALEHNLDLFTFPAWHKLPIFNYYDVFTYDRHFATLIATRGCPYICTFCDRKNRMGSLWRRRSTENIIAEIEMLKKQYNINEFMFFDDNFVVSKIWTEEFCYSVEPLNIKWECRARVDIMDNDLLKIMKKSGCYRIRYGMESGNDEILKTLKKGITVEQIKECAYLTKKSGIEIFAYFMLGNPYETPEQMQETIDLALEVDADFTLFSKTILIVGSELFDWAVKMKIIKKDYWLDYLNGNETNPAPTIPNPYTQKYIKKANQKFYMRPAYIYRRLKSIKSFYQFKKQFKMAKGLL